MLHEKFAILLMKFYTIMHLFHNVQKNKILFLRILVPIKICAENEGILAVTLAQ